jgi:hypothetical protein
LRAGGALLVAFVLNGCAAQATPPTPPTPPRAGAGGGPLAERDVLREPGLKGCGSRADFPAHHPVSWVEDRTQQLCCSPRGEGGAWSFVAPEACVSRYAPGVPLPDMVEPSAAATEGAPPNEAACAPGVEARVVIPTSELEARLDSGSLLRIESCLGERCAGAVVSFDSLARDDQLLFALHGEAAAGVSLAWRAGAVRLSVKVPQLREAVVQGQRYRFSLLLDGKPLASIDTTLDYAAQPPNGCPLARVSAP